MRAMREGLVRLERGRSRAVVSAPSLILEDLGSTSASSSGCERFRKPVRPDSRQASRTFPRRCRATCHRAWSASRRRGCATSPAMPQRAGGGPPAAPGRRTATHRQRRWHWLRSRAHRLRTSLGSCRYAARVIIARTARSTSQQSGPRYDDPGLGTVEGGTPGIGSRVLLANDATFASERGGARPRVPTSWKYCKGTIR